MKQFVLKLYVAGRTARTEQAVSSLREMCERHLADAYTLSVIDVLEWPHLAEQEKVLATPTLVKELPPPLRRVVGDLSDWQKLLRKLELPVGDALQKGNIK